MDTRASQRAALAAALQLLTLNSQLLARQLRRPDIRSIDRAVLVQRTTRLHVALDICVRAVEALALSPDHPAITHHLTLVAGQVDLIDRQVRATELRPHQVADAAHGLHAVAAVLLTHVDAALAEPAATEQ